MSTLKVAKLESYDATTDLTVISANASGPSIVLSSANSNIYVSGNLIANRANINSINVASAFAINAGGTEDVRFDSTGNVLIGRTTSTVGQNVKLDVNGAVNASAVLVNGTELTSGVTTGKAIAMAIVFG